MSGIKIDNEGEVPFVHIMEKKHEPVKAKIAVPVKKVEAPVVKAAPEAPVKKIEAPVVKASPAAPVKPVEAKIATTVAKDIPAVSVKPV